MCVCVCVCVCVLFLVFFFCFFFFFQEKSDYSNMSSAENLPSMLSVNNIYRIYHKFVTVMPAEICRPILDAAFF